MQDDNMQVSAQEQTEPAVPQDASEGGEDLRRFTQKDVDRIVSERLARERAKTAAETEAEALARRERELALREQLFQLGYPTEAILNFLHFMQGDPTADFAQLQAQLEGLVEALVAQACKLERYDRALGESIPMDGDAGMRQRMIDQAIQEIFKNGGRR